MLPFLYRYMKFLHDLFYITVKYHENIPKGIQIIGQIIKCLRKDGRKDGIPSLNLSVGDKISTQN